MVARLFAFMRVGKTKPPPVMQAGLATLVNLCNPGIELAAAFPASLLFGGITLRTGSSW